MSFLNARNSKPASDVSCSRNISLAEPGPEDLLHVAAAVGDAPVGPGPHVEDRPVYHCRVEQGDLVTNVLLQLIQSCRPGVVDFAFEISPQEKIKWRQVW